MDKGGKTLNTIILTDSGCDLPLEYIRENGDKLDILGMPVNIDGNEYIDDLGKSLLHDELYMKLRSGIIPSTAQINIYKYTKKFEEYYNDGRSIICLGLTSGLSGTFNNSILARREFLEEHPDADITIIDTFSASVGQGVLIVNVIEMLKQGKSNEEIIDWIEKNKMRVNHWFAVDDLHYLKKGGRISSVTSVVGTALNVKPILVVGRDGKLKYYTNVRGRRRSIKFLFDKLKEHIESSEETFIVIGHGNCPEDAEILKKLVLEEFNAEKVIISELSATIASHVGPNMLAIAFVGEERVI
jgi:DegV family protein with EDD domain